tara:strand:+ start:1090 stop:2652 length:1563 start_codon:yes stop_codon:yes gene_type:complete
MNSKRVRGLFWKKEKLIFQFKINYRLNFIRKLTEETAIYGFSSMFGRLLNFLLVPLYTSIFSTGDYGLLSILMTFTAFTMVSLTYGFETSFFYFTKKNNSKEIVLSTSFISLLFSSLIFVGITFYFSDSISLFLHDRASSMFVKILSLTILFDVLTVIPFAKLRLENRSWKFAYIRILNIVVNIGLNLFFFLLCPYWIQVDFAPNLIELIYNKEIGIGYVFISNLAASFFMLLMLLTEIKKIKAQFDLQLWKKMWRYSFPILIGGLAYITNEMADKLLLDYLLPSKISTRQVGIYSACYKISIFMTLFLQAFRYGAEPFFFEQAKRSNATIKYAEVMRFFVAFGCFIFLAVNVFIDLLKHFIQDSSYHEGLKVVPILLMANLFLGVYYNLSVWYKITEKTKFGALISLIGAFITIGLNIMLIPTMSYMGSALATLICYSAMCLISFKLGRRHYPIPYDWECLFYLICSVGLYVFWKSFHDNYFILSCVVCLGYIFIVYTSEKKKNKYFQNLIVELKKNEH